MAKLVLFSIAWSQPLFCIVEGKALIGSVRVGSVHEELLLTLTRLELIGIITRVLGSTRVFKGSEENFENKCLKKLTRIVEIWVYIIVF